MKEKKFFCVFYSFGCITNIGNFVCWSGVARHALALFKRWKIAIKILSLSISWICIMYRDQVKTTLCNFFFFNGHRMRKTIAPESQNTSKIKKILNHRQFLNRTLNYKVHSWWINKFLFFINLLEYKVSEPRIRSSLNSTRLNLLLKNALYA